MSRAAAPTAGGAARTVELAGGLAGLAAIVCGTFLPWLASGSRIRNSYRAGAAVQHLSQVPGWLRNALPVWPFVGLVCGLVAALCALGFERASAMLAIAVGCVAAGVSTGVLSIHNSAVVRPHLLGPVTTLAGAVGLVCAATTLLFTAPRPPTRS